MTYLERKLAGICTRTGCDAPCCETSCLCDPHRLEANARVQKHLAEKRDELRKQRRCVDCRCKTKRYRCFGCAFRLKAGAVVSTTQPSSA